MSSQIRIGIIGSGGIAQAHARAYKEIADVDIVAVADIVPGRAEQFTQIMELPYAKAFQQHQDLLKLGLDGVSICTPNVAHHRTSIDALLAKTHVLLEKPMSVTLAEAVEMVQVSKKSGKILTIGFQPRYDPNMAIIKQIVQSNQLGKVYYVQAGGGRRRGMPGGTFIQKEIAGAGAMADIGCYSLDLVMNALSYPKPLTVTAFTSNYFGTNPLYHAESSKFDVEDFGVAMVRFENDVVLNFKISWAMHMDTLGDTLFLGTEGGLKIKPAGAGVWSGAWDGKVGSIQLFHDIQGHHTDSNIPLKEHKINLFYEKVADFVRAVREDAPAPIPGEQIVRNQAVIDGILRSSASGREVEIHIPHF